MVQRMNLLIVRRIMALVLYLSIDKSLLADSIFDTTFIALAKYPAVCTLPVGPSLLLWRCRVSVLPVHRELTGTLYP